MKLNRRDFLAGTGAFAAPLILNGCCSCFKSNEKINVGVVGIGRISTTMDIPNTIVHTDLCRFTAVCDLDSKRLMHGVRFIKDQYRKLTGEANAPVKAYADYRDLMADPSIDAVMICIPDHWHALVAVEVTSFDGLNNEMLVKLGEKGVKTLDDFADLASDELLEIVGDALTEKQANEMIMRAREHWFVQESLAEK